MKLSPILRSAAHAAIDAFFDTVEQRSMEHATRRPAVSHPPARPLRPVSDLDREAARKELRRMGAYEEEP